MEGTTGEKITCTIPALLPKRPEPAVEELKRPPPPVVPDVGVENPNSFCELNPVFVLAAAVLPNRPAVERRTR